MNQSPTYTAKRFSRTIAILIAAALLAAPTGSARIAEESGIGEPVNANLVQERESGIVEPASGNLVQERESGIVEPVPESVVLTSSDRFDWMDAGVGAATTAGLSLLLALAAFGARARLRSTRELRPAS